MVPICQKNPPSSQKKTGPLTTNSGGRAQLSQFCIMLAIFSDHCSAYIQSYIASGLAVDCSFMSLHLLAVYSCNMLMLCLNIPFIAVSIVQAYCVLYVKFKASNMQSVQPAINVALRTANKLQIHPGVQQRVTL